MNVTILNPAVGSFGYWRYTCAVTYIDGQVTETRIQYWPSNSLKPAWRMVGRSGRKGREIIHTTDKTYRTFARFYELYEFENPVPYTWRGLDFPARTAFPLETPTVIVKLSCSCCAETPCPGYTHGESLRCPSCDTVERIVAIESDQPITRNRLTGAGAEIKCEECGTLFSGENTRCLSCTKELEFNLKAQAWAIAHNEEF